MQIENDGMTHAERKRKVLAQGALYRLGVMEARQVVRENLSAESLAKTALSRVFHAATSVFGGGKSLQSIKSLKSLSSASGVNMQTVTPFLLTGFSLLSKRWLRKPLLYGGIVSAIGGLAYYLSHRRNGGAENADSADIGPVDPGLE